MTNGKRSGNQCREENQRAAACMNKQTTFDSSLIPTDADHDKRWKVRSCGECAEEMSAEDVEAEAETQDGLCICCRSYRAWASDDAGYEL